MATNPTSLRWQQPKTHTDGTAFGQADFGGYELAVNDDPAVGIPAGWVESGQYNFPIQLLGLVPGNYRVKLRVVSKDGQASDWTPEVTFALVKVPSAPLGFSAV